MSRRTAYAAHARFIAPALATPGARPVILGFIIVESLYRIGQQLLGLGLETLAPDFAQAVFEGSTPAGLLVNLGSFAILGLSLALVLAHVHGRGLSSLLGPRPGFWRQAGLSFLAVALIFLLTETLLGSSGPGPAPEVTLRPLPQWLALLGPALLALLIQTGSEELFYRGYLQQQIAALLPHPAAWLIVPNLAFAFAHFSPYAAADENLAYLAWTFAFGLAASDLVARAGTLAPALALHMANNAFAFLIFGEEDSADSGLALVLYRAPDDALTALPPASPLEALPAELALLALAWGATRLALRR